MCGIAGILGSNSEDTANLLLRQVRHRGPDNQSLWCSPPNEYPAALVHSRLSVQDTRPDSNQPFHSACGRYVLTYNGEIYNFPELRTQLSSRGIKFSTFSDTEVLLQGLILFGVSFLDSCNGMWAFCLWDRLSGSAILCRDRFGVKPLYYSRLLPTVLAFSSEIKGLTPLLESLEPADELPKFFHYPFSYEATPFTPVKGIHRLPPGSFLSFRNSTITVDQWWKTHEHIRPSDQPYSQQLSQWSGLFSSAVALRLRSDIPIGFSVSGGLDSSSVLATALSHSTSNLNHSSIPRIAYCASYPNSSLDESKYAYQLCSKLGITLLPITFDHPPSLDEILNDIALVEEPYLTMANPMLRFYQAVKNHGTSVLLEGHGSDELFCGYGHLLSYLRTKTTLSGLKEILDIHHSTTSPTFTPSYRNHLKSRLRVLIYKLLFTSKSNLASLKNRFFNPFPHPDYSDSSGYLSLDCFNQVLYDLFHSTTLPTLLRNYDRYSMASAVETRMPFLDHRLVTHSFSLPSSSKNRKTFTKSLLRDSMRHLLPPEILYRRHKIGWNAPMHDWFSSILFELQSRSDIKLSPSAHSAVRRYNLSPKTFTSSQTLWQSLQPDLWIHVLRTSPLWH